ncbi:MAG: hypothetical protein ACREJO_01295 [Phycisphaerales bacterium]
MPPTAWYAAVGVLVFCLVWRLGFYALWRGSFCGRPVGMGRLREDSDSRVVRLRPDGSPAGDMRSSLK